MFPIATVNNVRDGSAAHAEFACQIGAWLAVGMTGADKAYRLFREARSRIEFAAQYGFRLGSAAVRVAVGMSPFAHHVGDVIGDGAEKEMGRVDTRGVIAARTVVEHTQTSGDRSVMQFPGNLMGGTVATINARLAVATARFSRNPKPATIALVDVRPEAGLPTVALKGVVANRGAESPATLLDLLRVGKEWLAALFAGAGDGTIVGHRKTSYTEVLRVPRPRLLAQRGGFVLPILPDTAPKIAPMVG